MWSNIFTSLSLFQGYKINVYIIMLCMNYTYIYIYECKYGIMWYFIAPLTQWSNKKLQIYLKQMKNRTSEHRNKRYEEEPNRNIHKHTYTHTFTHPSQCSCKS